MNANDKVIRTFSKVMLKLRKTTANVHVKIDMLKMYNVQSKYCTMSMIIDNNGNVLRLDRSIGPNS